jgi:lysophospholipase L1-like esterase
MIREERALVLVLDIPPFGPRLEHHVPGLGRRRLVFQEVMADIVGEAADADVRLVAVSEVVEELGAEIAVPDGLHFSPVGHRRIADLLTEEIAGFVGRHGATAS